VLHSGEVLSADALILATGYLGQQELVRRMFTDEIADRVGPIWGIDNEGEMCNMWRRTGQEGLWFTAGSLAQSRDWHGRVGGLLLDRRRSGPIDRGARETRISIRPATSEICSQRTALNDNDLGRFLPRERPVRFLTHDSRPSMQAERRELAGYFNKPTYSTLRARPVVPTSRTLSRRQVRRAGGDLSWTAAHGRRERFIDSIPTMTRQ
jgi:hypothetical protein